MNRVWKGIFGIRDLTKIQCGIRENAKYFDGIRELTTSREAGLKRIWARDAGILARLLGIREIFTRLDEYNDRESESNRRVLTGKSLLLKNKNKQLSSVTKRVFCYKQMPGE